MAKTKRILAFVSAVIILFTLSLGFAGCDDRKDVTVYLYLIAPWIKDDRFVDQGSYRNIRYKEEIDDRIDNGSAILLRQWSKEDMPDEKDPIVLSFGEVENWKLMVRYIDGSTYKSEEWYEPKICLSNISNTIARGGTFMAELEESSILDVNDRDCIYSMQYAYKITKANKYYFGFRITEDNAEYKPMCGSCYIIVKY